MEMETKFWRHAKKGAEDDCWLWGGSLSEKGYGRIKHYQSRKWVKAHRYSYELHHGEIPAGMLVLHSCDNRACVNPKHLRLGTSMDNSMDMRVRGRVNITANRRGGAHPHAKLTETDIPLIRDRVKAGEAMALVAFDYEVGVSTIHSIIRGRSWKHVPGGEPIDTDARRNALLTDAIKTYIDQRILELLRERS